MPLRTSNLPLPTLPEDPTNLSWRLRLRPRYLYQLVRDNPISNLLLIFALIIGFLHGWLKYKYPGGIMVYAYDIPLMIALGLSMLTVSKGLKLFPKSRTSTALQIVLGLCIIYGLLPTEVPYLVRLASFRGWALVPLMYLMGYHLFRSREQLIFYGMLILLMSVITAIYGARQDPEVLRQMAEANQTLENMMRGSFYADEGVTKFRAFSTFVSAAAFGSTMAYSLLIGLAWISYPGMKLGVRLLLAVIMIPTAYGIFLSASRSAIVIVGISLLIIAWYRRTLFKLAVPVALLLGVLLVVANLLGVSSLNRLSVLADPTVVMSRLYIVVRPAMNHLLENPLGGGLGRSGHGLPSALGHLVSLFDWKPVDGDVGRVAVDFGVFGLVAFTALFVAGSRDSLLWMRRLRGTGLETTAVTAGTMFIAAFICFPVGSPFLAIPVGAIIWFHLGALNRLYEDHERSRREGLLSKPTISAGIPIEAQKTNRPFLYAPNPPRPTPPPAQPANAKPKKFLYHGTGSKAGPRR